jgi:hypothetical protein
LQLDKQYEQVVFAKCHLGLLKKPLGSFKLKGESKMEQKVDNKKKIVKVVIWVVVILAVMATMHTLVNYFDLFTFLQSLHGG